MEILKGIPVSGGVVIGRAYVLDEARSIRVPRRPIRPDQADAEQARFETARAAAIADLSAVHKASEREMGPEAAKIFLFHIGALSDKKSVVDPIRAMIASELVTAEHAVSVAFQRLGDAFAKRSDSTFQTKVNDIYDLADRLLGHLIGQKTEDLSDAPDNAVVLAQDLTPSQTAGFDRSRIAAFVTDLGGPTSHTAIVARALRLPAVVGVQRAVARCHDGQTVIVDADHGKIILDPDDETLDRYAKLAEQDRAADISLGELANLPAVTADGVSVCLVGNIEFPDECERVLSAGGEGVGLYRTEFLYLTRPTEPTEEDHYHAYKRCVELLAGKPLTIRTVDLGADKYTQARAQVPERNPFLGLRSIRYCLQHLPMFKTQLRAILRASAHGPIKVMFPLITSTDEFRRARMLFHDAMEDLEDLGIPFDRSIDLGMMVEVPSAALGAPAFAREVAFFSIGTNDLVQYTLAVDRTNERVAHLYNPAHPAVLRLIRDVVRAGNRYKVPVSCCGEAASQPELAALLLGVGVRTLSVTPSAIPRIKRAVRSLTIAQCERIAKKAISLDSDAEATSLVRDRVRKLLPEDLGGRSAD
jgi:phosphotransferase system enzyme I (PtsI)